MTTAKHITIQGNVTMDWTGTVSVVASVPEGSTDEQMEEALCAAAENEPLKWMVQAINDGAGGFEIGYSTDPNIEVIEEQAT